MQFQANGDPHEIATAFLRQANITQGRMHTALVDKVRDYQALVPNRAPRAVADVQLPDGIPSRAGRADGAAARLAGAADLGAGAANIH